VERALSKGPTGRPDERGATLVEFAFILPIFVLFALGFIDLGWAFAQNLDVKQGAREGGRIVSVDGAPGPAPPNVRASRPRSAARRGSSTRRR
jgi:Flp pilus assembly protein TadG